MTSVKSPLVRQATTAPTTFIKQHGIEVTFTTHEEMDGGSYVNYIMEVHKDNKTWEIRKRYSDFRFFYQAVAEHCSKMSVSFPSKTVGKLNKEQVEKRQKQLQEWVSDFLETVSMTPGVLNQVNAFFKVHLSSDESAPTGERIDNPVRISPGRVLKAGYLSKLGGNKQGQSGNWKKRYVVLQDDIKYYENEQTFVNGGLPKGIVKLNAFFCVPTDGANPQFEFTIHAMPYSFTCRAESAAEMNSWVETLSSMAEIV